MNKVFVSFSLLLLFKVVSGEWVLGVQVQEFETMYNSELIGDQLEYCCCDIPPETVNCATSITDLNSAACFIACNSYLETHLEVCFLDETCFVNDDDNAVVGSIFGTCIGPPLVQLSSSETVYKSISSITLSVTAWEDDGEPGGDDMMDQFMISLPSSVSDVNQVHTLTVTGEYGIGSLTLTYFNQSIDPDTSCSSVAPLSCTSSSAAPTETITTSIYITSVVVMTSCPSDMTTSSAMPDSTVLVSTAASTSISVSITSVPGPAASSDVTSVFVSSIAIPGSTTMVEDACVHSVWRILAILVIVIAILLVFTSAVLVFIICRMKKGPSTRRESHITTQDDVCYHQNDAYDIVTVGRMSASNGNDTLDDTKKKNAIYDEVSVEQ